MNIESKRLLGMVCLWVCTAGPAWAVTVNVVADGLSFIPADVTIDVGDSVQWTGLDPFHNVAQVDDAMDNTYNGGFRSGDVGDVSDYTFTFNTPGVYHYVCEPHVFAGMRGTVTVTAPAPTLTPAGAFLLIALVIASGICVQYRRRRMLATVRV